MESRIPLDRCILALLGMKVDRSYIDNNTSFCLSEKILRVDVPDAYKQGKHTCARYGFLEIDRLSVKSELYH